MAQSRKTSHIFGSVDILNYEDVNNRRITSVGDPLLPTDASNKQYVDNIIIANDLHSGIGITVNTNGNTININSIQPTITGLGTIQSGVWNGSTIQIGYGGTGQTTFTPNALLYYPGSNSISSTEQLTFDTTVFKSTVPIVISNTNNSDVLGNGAFSILGGAFISKDLNILGNANVIGNISVNDITINGNLSLNNIIVNNGIFTNVSSSSLTCNLINNNIINSSNITGFLISTSNLICTNNSINNLISKFNTLGNAIFTNITSSSLNVPGITFLSTTNCHSLSTGALSIVDGKSVNFVSSYISCGNINVTSIANIANSITDNSTITNLKVINQINTLNINSFSISSTNSNISNLTCNNFTLTNSTISNGLFTNISTNNINITNTLNSNSVSTGNLYVKSNISCQSINAANGIIANITTSNIQSNTLITSNLTSNLSTITSLIVSQNTVLQGNLTTSLNTVLQGNLTVSLNTVLQGNLTTSLNTILKGNLTVVSSANLQSSLSVSGGSYFNTINVSSNSILNNLSVSNITSNTLVVIGNINNLNGSILTKNISIINTTTANLLSSNGVISNLLCINNTSVNVVSLNITTSSLISTNNTFTNLMLTNTLFTSNSSIGNNYVVNSSVGNTNIINSTISNLMVNQNINLISNYSGSNIGSIGSFFNILPSIFTNNTSIGNISSWYANYISASTLQGIIPQITNKSSNLYIQSNVNIGANETINYNSALSIGYCNNLIGGNLNTQISFERADGNQYSGIYTENSTNKLVIINASLSGGGGLGMYTINNTPVTFSSIPSSLNITPIPYIQLLNTTSTFLSTLDSTGVSSGSLVLMGGLAVSKTINCSNLNVNGNINIQNGYINGSGYGLFTLNLNSFVNGTSNITFNTVFDSRITINNEIITFTDPGIYNLNLILNSNTNTTTSTLIQTNLNTLVSGNWVIYQTSQLNAIYDTTTQINGNFMINVIANQQVKFTLNNGYTSNFIFSNLLQYSRLIVSKVG